MATRYGSGFPAGNYGHLPPVAGSSEIRPGLEEDWYEDAPPRKKQKKPQHQLLPERDEAAFFNAAQIPVTRTQVAGLLGLPESELMRAPFATKATLWLLENRHAVEAAIAAAPILPNKFARRDWGVFPPAYRIDEPSRYKSKPQEEDFAARKTRKILRATTNDPLTDILIYEGQKKRDGITVNWRRDDAPYQHVYGERLKLLKKGFMVVVNDMMRTGQVTGPQVTLSGIKTLAVNTAWFELQRTPISSREEQPNRLSQTIKWLPHRNGAAGDKGAFSVEYHVSDTHWTHLITLDPDKISDIEPPPPPALSPLSFEHINFPTAMSADQKRTVRLLEWFTQVLLPYRADMDKTLRVTWRLTTDARWIPGQGRKRVDREWYEKPQCLKITEPEATTGRRFFALYTAGPDLIILRHMPYPPNIARGMDVVTCDEANDRFGDGGNYFVAIEAALKMVARLEGADFAEAEAAVLLQELSDRDVQLDRGQRTADDEAEETQSGWIRGDNTSVSRKWFGRAYDVCNHDRASARNASNRLWYQSPRQILSGLTQMDTCSISGVDLATQGNKGMSPSIDANNIIMVDTVAAAAGESRRYIHHERNVNVIPAAANIAKGTFPLSTFFRICQNVAVTIASYFVTGNEPEGMKELESVARTSFIVAEDEERTKLIDERAQKCRQTALLSSIAVPYIREDRGDPTKTSDVMIRAFYHQDKLEVDQLVAEMEMEMPSWTMNFPPGLAPNETELPVFDRELKRMRPIAQKKDRSTVRPRRYELAGAAKERRELNIKILRDAEDGEQGRGYYRLPRSEEDGTPYPFTGDPPTSWNMMSLHNRFCQLAYRTMWLCDRKFETEEVFNGTTATLTMCVSTIKQGGRDAVTGSRFHSDYRDPLRLVIAATEPGIPMITGWNTAEPSSIEQHDDSKRTMLAQQCFSNLFYWDLTMPDFWACLQWVIQTFGR